MTRTPSGFHPTRGGTGSVARYVAALAAMLAAHTAQSRKRADGFALPTPNPILDQHRVEAATAKRERRLARNRRVHQL